MLKYPLKSNTVHDLRCTNTDKRRTLEIARRCRVRRVTIVADLDAPKPKSGGGTWRPGLDGAKQLGRTLGLPFRIVLPPPDVKDFRDWRQAGGMCPAKFCNEAAAAFWQGPYTKGER